MIAFVFNYGLTLADVSEPLVPKDYVAIKPVKVALNGIENAIYNGQIWARPGTILGGIGIAKVIEGGVDSEWSSLAGRLVVVSPYSRAYGGLGSEINGIAAERAAVPKDAIFPYFSELGDLNVLLPFASIAVKAAEEAEGRRMLIVGYGVLGKLVALASKDKANVGIYTEDRRVDLGISVADANPSEWDVVFVSALNTWPRVFFSGVRKLLMPRFMKSWPVIEREKLKFIEPEFVDEAVALLKSNAERLKDVIVYSDSFSSAIPVPKGKIVLVDAEKALRITTSP